ncbi:MAG: BrnA antitoxin family protein [Candidatus Contendobacter sp.]|jgi:uncharacterized protein (DUF4415 family)|nr:BrnA antitoxin family protein [Candidatus Contendobacter sp.]
MSNRSTLPTVDDGDPDEVPPIAQADIDQAVYPVNLEPMLRKKQKISIALDPEVVAWFKAKAGKRGYQTLINQALHLIIISDQIESTLRRVIREELTDRRSS